MKYSWPLKWKKKCLLPPSLKEYSVFNLNVTNVGRLLEVWLSEWVAHSTKLKKLLFVIVHVWPKNNIPISLLSLTIPKRGLYSLVHVSIWRYSDDGVGTCSRVTCHPILTMSADIWNCSSATVLSFNSWSFFSVIVSSYSIVLIYMSPSTSVSCTHSSRLTQSIKYDHFISRCIIAQ